MVARPPGAAEPEERGPSPEEARERLAGIPYNRAVSNLEPRLLEAAGRLHVLIVHLPIGLILAAGAIELLGRGRKRPGTRSAARWTLGLGALFALLGAATGWIHAEYVAVGRALSGTLLLHRCGGIATALAAGVTWAISRPAGKVEGESPFYRVGLFVSCGLVTLTGHWGGTLVHGPGYLLEPLLQRRELREGEVVIDMSDRGSADEAPDRTPEAPARGSTGTGDANAAVDYERDVRPILAARCYECHGERRQRGKLRLDLLHELLAREGQDVIVRGAPDASELIARVELPADDVDVMPAKGETLTADQIATLRRWIAAGAPLPAAVAPEAPDAGASSGAQAPGTPDES